MIVLSISLTACGLKERIIYEPVYINIEDNYTVNLPLEPSCFTVNRHVEFGHITVDNNTFYTLDNKSAFNLVYNIKDYRDCILQWQQWRDLVCDITKSTCE